MDLSLLMFFAFGGIVMADTDAAWQIMVCQPLVACSIAGVILGNMTLGLTVGLLLQLPYLVEAPVGGTQVSLGNLGAFVASGVALHLTPSFADRPEMILVTSLILGILISRLATPLSGWLRYLNLLLARKADHAAANAGVRTITFLHCVGVASSLVFGTLFVALLFAVASFVAARAVTLAPVAWESKLFLVKPMLLGAGVGAMLRLFVRKRSIKFAALGAAFSGLLIFFTRIG